MATYVTDEERVEQIKRWWAENGYYLVGGLFLGLAILVGWNYWKDSQINRSAGASIQFSNVVTTGAMGNREQLEGYLASLKNDFSGTPYSSLAQLHGAKVFVEQGDLERAEEALRYVAANGEEFAVAQVAQLRLARVLLAQGKSDEALTVVNAVTDPAYVSLQEEVRGDILVKTWDIDKARVAYATALLTAGARADFLQLKQDNLGTK